MKKASILFALVLMSLSAMAQQEETNTLFNGPAKITGWFVELPSTVARVQEKEIFLPGLSAGIVLNNSLRVGLSGYSYNSHFNRVFIAEADNGLGGYLTGSEGGVYIEPVLGGKRLLHLSFPILVGGGYADIQTKELYADEEQLMDEKKLAEQSYMLIRPGLQAELNLHQNVRLGLGAGYRFTLGNETSYLDQFDLGGFSAMISLKVGRF